jgi:K(+)-stimulated pyrophosphate-energized sodium pump
MNVYFLIPVACGVSALLFAVGRIWWLQRQSPQHPPLILHAARIRAGVQRFSRKEFRLIGGVIAVAAVPLFFYQTGPMRLIVVSFIIGALCTSIAGAVGVWASTAGNIRTAEVSGKSTFKALQTALRGGSVMGLTVVGLALTVLTLLLALYTRLFGCSARALECTVLPALSGYALGAGIVALFGRIAGGIYAKAADVSADVIGKIEYGMEEDDPGNPASLADSIGDNVSDVGGLGLDASESYVGAIVGAMIIGASMQSTQLTYLPLLLMGAGICASIIAYYLVRMPDYGDPHTAIIRSIAFGDILSLGFGFIAIRYMLPMELTLRIFSTYAIGLVTGIGISYITAYYTSRTRPPVVGIAGMAEYGASTAVTQGLAVGMIAVGLPTVLFAVAALTAFQSFGVYGLGIAAVGLLSCSGLQVAVDASGPITDNAGALAVRARLTPATRERTDKLDAVGNLFNAVGKGYTVMAAAFTTLVLFVAYKEVAGISVIDLTRLPVLIGIFLGAAFPFVFSATILSSVNQVSAILIGEARQILSRKDAAAEEFDSLSSEFNQLIESESLQRIFLPGIGALVMPVLIWFLGGENMLGGFVIGILVSGTLLALLMSNAGGSWDNAKKHIEAGAYGGKGSSAHQASVISDTVGDPLKDAVGPAMDILMKLVAIIAIVLVSV